MKINIYIPVLTVGLFISGATTAFAQWEKTLMEGARKYPGKVTEYFPRTISGTKRFQFPKQTVTPLKAALTTSLERAAIPVTKTPAAIPSTTWAQVPHIAPFGPMDVLAGQTAHQQFISLVETENTFYQQEITHAVELTGFIKHRASFQEPLSDHETIAIIEKLSFIQNDYLRLQSYRNLLANDLPAMLQDLTDYFSIDKPFAEAAFSYTVRHPHKRNLRTLRLLHNPFIADSFKAPIKQALQKSALTVPEQAALLNALKAINEEYQQIVTHIKQEHQLQEAQALASEQVQEHLALYEQTFDEIEKFVDQHGRLPQWQTRSMEERHLYLQAKDLTSPTSAWPFEPFTSKRAELETLLKKYEPQQRTRQETLEAFEQFVASSGRIYPRRIDDGLDVTEEEYKLYEDLLHWRIVSGASMERRIQEIQRKHAFPTQDPFYF